MQKLNLRKLCEPEILPIACFFLLAFLTQITLYGDYDLWWHLALGKSIVQEGAIYSTDTFSYTFAGADEFRSEWLADLLIYLSHSLGGMAGLYALKITIILGMFYYVLITIKLHTADEVAYIFAIVVALVLVLLAIKFRLFIRSYLFSYLFMSLYMYRLSKYDEQGEIRVLYPLPVLQIVWANLQSSAFFGPMLLCLLLVASVVSKEKRSRLKSLFGLFLLVSIAALLSPSGAEPYIDIFSFVTSSKIQAIGEWQPLTTDLLWGYGLRYTFAYTLIVVLSVIYFVTGGYRRIFFLFIFVLFLVESVRHVRMISFLSIVAAPFAAMGLIYIINLVRQQALFASRTVLLITSALVLSLIPATVLYSETYTFGVGITEDTFPDGALKFLDEQGIEGRMLNSYSFGGYIIWKAPGRKVFIDGRHAHLYPLEFHESYEEIISNAEAWQEAEDRWGIDYAVLEYDLRAQKFPLHLNENPNWALVYWDNISAVYLKRTDANKPVIENREYVVSRPNFNDLGYVGTIYKSTGNLPSLLQALQREIDLNPKNQEPRLAKVMAMYMGGKAYYEEILKELDITIDLRPDLSIEHSAAAFVSYNLGDMDRAKRELALALELDPNDYQALELKHTIAKTHE